MAAFARRLKVSKTDSFTLDVSAWLGDESILTLNVTEQATSLVTIGASVFDGGNLTVLLTGVATGAAEVHFDYTTATRSDCYKSTVIVIDDC